MVDARQTAHMFLVFAMHMATLKRFTRLAVGFRTEADRTRVASEGITRLKLVCALGAERTATIGSEGLRHALEITSRAGRERRAYTIVVCAWCCGLELMIVVACCMWIAHTRRMSLSCAAFPSANMVWVAPPRRSGDAHRGSSAYMLSNMSRVCRLPFSWERTGCAPTRTLALNTCCCLVVPRSTLLARAGARVEFTCVRIHMVAAQWLVLPSLAIVVAFLARRHS